MTQIGFLDDLGRELDDAAGRLIRAQRQARRRLVLPAAAVALLAVAGVALWPSPPVDPEREVAAPRDPLAAELVGLLAPARRAADPAEARLATEAVDGFGRDPDLRMELGSARVLRSEGGEGYVLIAPAKMQVTPRRIKSVACVYRTDPSGPGGGGGCFTAEMIRTGVAMGSTGREHFGLVPDGVATVEVRWPMLERTAAVENNLYVVDGPQEVGVRTIVFYDARGEVIAEHPGP